jgi:hypothetical protein
MLEEGLCRSEGGSSCFKKFPTKLWRFSLVEFVVPELGEVCMV